MRLLARCAAALMLGLSAPATAAPERPELVVGYVKQADLAPFALALDRGYFAEEGLNVRLEEARTWTEMAERLAQGGLDAGQMLATQPVASAAGMMEGPRFVASTVLAANGGAITVSNGVWRRMRRYVRLEGAGRPVHPISAGALLEVFGEFKRQGQPMQMGVDHPLSPSNYLLRYWMAAGGGHPGFYSAEDPKGDLRADIALLEFPTVFMPVALRADLLDGYAVAAPWGQQALLLDTGVPVVTQDQIAPMSPQTVLGVTEAFAAENPETVLALTKALLRACRDLSKSDRLRAAELMRRPEYLGLSAQALQSFLDGSVEYERGDLRPAPRFGLFFKEYATYPYLSDAIWYLTQMRRWGQIGEPKIDTWYWETAAAAFKPDIYEAAAAALVAEGKAEASDFPTDPGPRRDLSPAAAGAQGFIDFKSFDPVRPNAYIDGFAVGLKSNEFVERGQVFAVSIEPAVNLVKAQRVNRAE
ncbi:MAG: CmpA/NrtA family ABC transporter substrate-binding protein [Pseudomonadota bacterium]